MNKTNLWIIILGTWVVGGIYLSQFNGSLRAQTSQYIQHYADPSTPFPYKYNTVAASQSTQALTGGGGGAIGDYLSGCTVFPATTTPGVVTIFDNSTTVAAFAGGTTTVVPFRIQIDAASKSGGWKVTTGASVSVVCNGSFT